MKFKESEGTHFHTIFLSSITIKGTSKDSEFGYARIYYCFFPKHSVVETQACLEQDMTKIKGVENYFKKVEQQSLKYLETLPSQEWRYNQDQSCLREE